MPVHYYNIVIIGGGISGLSAASFLSKNGLTSIKVLEATERLGGRIQTKFYGSDCPRFEFGAHFIHGIDRNPVYRIAQENGLLKVGQRKIRDLVLHRKSDGSDMSSKSVLYVDMLYGRLICECEEFYGRVEPSNQFDDRCGNFIRTEFEKHDAQNQNNPDVKEEVDLVLQHRLCLEANISGADSMNEVSLSALGSYEELTGVHCVVPGGFEAAVSAIRRDLPTKSIQLNTPVNQICWSEPLPVCCTYGADSCSSSCCCCKAPEFVKRQRPSLDACLANSSHLGNSLLSANRFDRNLPQTLVKVLSSSGEVIYADHVICTFSLGYLQAYHEELFEPRLDKCRVEAIRSLGFGCVNKIIAQYAEPILADNVSRVELFTDRSVLELPDRNLSNTWTLKIDNLNALDSCTVVGWLHGSEAEYIETIDDDVVQDTFNQWIKGFLRLENMPPLKRFVRTKWHSSKFIKGSYTFVPVNTPASSIDKISEPLYDANNAPRVLFAGEHTHPKYYSTTHGALLSGVREAKRLLDYLGISYDHSDDEHYISDNENTDRSRHSSAENDSPLWILGSEKKMQLDMNITPSGQMNTNMMQ